VGARATAISFLDRTASPIGPASQKWLTVTIDRLSATLEGRIGGGHARRICIKRSGEYLEATGERLDLDAPDRGPGATNDAGRTSE
jgi:hypothetical protein